jgi:hypothetical protein
MPKVDKYGNFAHESDEVTLEALRNRLVGLGAASHVCNLCKDK